MTYYYQSKESASGYRKTARELMPEEEYKRYWQYRQDIYEEYFDLAIKSDITEDLLDPNVFLEITDFYTSEQAWEKINEMKDLCELLKESND